MFSFLFREILYRPVLNILIFIYNHMPIYKDMGIAIIIFVLFMNLFLSPLRKNVEKTEKEQSLIIKELEKAEKENKGNLLAFKEAKKNILKKYRKTINLRGLDLLVEAIYFITFWWVFAIGLPRKNWHLLYSWVNYPQEPVNLTFLKLFDLTIVSPQLNLISAVGLFIVLFFHNWWKPEKANRHDYLILIWGPFAAYFISSQLPAGQEFFFTITEILHFLRLIRYQFKKIIKKYKLNEALEPLKDFKDTAWKQISGS